MTTWAVLPVKPLRLGKSRLAGVMNEDERHKLNQGLLENTLKVLVKVPQLERVLVISRDTQVLALAHEYGAYTLQESSGSNLNVALEKATRLAYSFAVRSVLAIPADLPLLTVEDVQALLSKGREAPVIAIVPDRHRRGTNAMLINPLGRMRYAFGRDSFRTHCREAQELDYHLEVVELPRLAVDLDTPDDLAFLNMTVEPQNELARILSFSAESQRTRRKIAKPIDVENLD